mmetsp:Transcript_3353/g.6643  ORF Transcript_3353/g.6643 Transcript_3353/m.6643 type:complete len:163 (-) Transcript_3353:68-556(-)
MQCKTASVDGAIEKAQDVVIHPNAVVRAANGASITIGAGCVIEELCVIEASSGCHIEIGRGNLFQVGSRIRALVVGDFNVFGVKSDVEHGASIGSGCEIGAGARIAPNTCMLDGVVVFRNGVNGEQSTGVAPRALEEHRISIDVHRQSLLQAGSRFLREHRP